MKFTSFFGFLFIVLLITGIAALLYMRAPGPLTENRLVLLERGSGFLEISDQLVQKGVIEHPFIFKGLLLITGSAKSLKAGEYEFAASATPLDVMTMLSAGKTVVHKLTVPEGFTTQMVLNMLASEPALSGNLPEGVEEGSLLPETYYFSRGDDRAQLLERMRGTMKDTLDQLWPARQQALPLTTAKEALILASIVEKETGIAAERGRVAAVFVNRLRRDMMLQSDPTVIYGIEREKGPLGRLLTTADLQAPTPYNTYVIVGLPPGPICNPGRAAIEAVLNPPQTNELYFVADGTGGHVFAPTLEEHNTNVARWRALQKKSQ